MSLVFQSVRQAVRSSKLPSLARTYAATSVPALDAGEQVIYNKLKEKFSPKELRVQDVSGIHIDLLSGLCPIDLK